MKRISLLSVILLLISCIPGCGAQALPQEADNNTSQDATISEAAIINRPEVAISEAAIINRPEVSISGTTFTVDETSYDIRNLDESINAILGCTYVTDQVFILEGHINPKVAFYALFDINTKNYVGSLYGTNCTWKLSDDGHTVTVTVSDSNSDINTSKKIYQFDMDSSTVN